MKITTLIRHPSERRDAYRFAGLDLEPKPLTADQVARSVRLVVRRKTLAEFLGG